MASLLDLAVNQNVSQSAQEKRFNFSVVLSMLFSRTILFILFQVLFYLYFILSNTASPWNESANWWPFTVSLTNLCCMLSLDILLKREGSRFLSFFQFEKGRNIRNYLTMSGLLVLCMPFAYLPNMLLGNALFGNYMDAVNMFYRPLPLPAAVGALFLFPVTMAVGELTTYFGYVMPRLEVVTKKKWIAITFPAIMLSIQHVALPLLFDWRFIVWRALMFLPFAFFMAFIIRWKPKLFPYILVGHVLIDMMNAVSVLMVSI